MDKEQILAEVHKKMYKKESSEVALIRVGDLIQILSSLSDEESHEQIAFRMWHDWEDIVQRRYNQKTKEWYNYPTFLQYLKQLDPSLPLVDFEALGENK